jgi:predicted AAA+ superfamily ATPase
MVTLTLPLSRAILGRIESKYATVHASHERALPAEAEQAEKEPATFLQRHPPPVLFDEVQYAPGLFRHLKVPVDAHRTRNGQFLLTGSQKFTLMKNVSESLAGRADIVELETLSFAEIQSSLPEVRIEVDSGTASEGDLLAIKSRTPSAAGAGWNRGLWYTLIGLVSNP